MGPRGWLWRVLQSSCSRSQLQLTRSLLGRVCTGSGGVVARSSFNRSPFAGVAAPEVTQETVESLMQKFKESFRTNTPIEIGQLQPALRSTSVGRRKRRSRPRGRLPRSPAAPRCPGLGHGQRSLAGDEGRSSSPSLLSRGTPELLRDGVKRGKPRAASSGWSCGDT